MFTGFKGKKFEFQVWVHISNLVITFWMLFLRHVNLDQNEYKNITFLKKIFVIQSGLLERTNPYAS